MIPRRRTRFLSTLPTLATLAAIAATIVGAKVARANDWGTPGLDGAHARLSTERSGALFAGSRWTARFPESARVLSSPVVAEGLMVNVDLGGKVRALRAEDGQLAWSAAVGSDVQGTPAVDRGRAFVPMLGNTVVALRLADGATVWTRDVGGMALSSPAPIDGDIVLSVGFPGKRVVRLAGTTGELVWQSPPVMEQFGNTSPAVGAGMVVVGSNGGHYYAFDAGTGALRWDYIADGIVNLAAPLISGGRVYFAGGNDSGHVHAVDLATGTAVAGWPVDLPAPEPDLAGTRLARQRAVSSFVSVGGLLVLQTRLDDTLDTDGDRVADRTLSREMVVALDPATGALAWQAARGRAEIIDPNDVPKFFVCPTPAGFASDSSSELIAAASSLEATVVILDAETGVERGRQAVAGAALASPVVANGRLHVVAMSGAIEAFASSVNHAPSAAIPASNPRALDAGQVALRWLPAVDSDAQLPSYELRIDTDGEVLESWQHQLSVAAGSTSVQLSDTFTPGVRPRRVGGALSLVQASDFLGRRESPCDRKRICRLEPGRGARGRATGGRRWTGRGRLHFVQHPPRERRHHAARRRGRPDSARHDRPRHGRQRRRNCRRARHHRGWRLDQGSDHLHPDHLPRHEGSIESPHCARLPHRCHLGGRRRFSHGRERDAGPERDRRSRRRRRDHQEQPARRQRRRARE